MNAEDIEEEVLRWFQERYPGNPDPECHATVPAPLRAIVFTGLVEGEISNGGLPQLLWNTFRHWRAVLDDAEMGYRLIGAAQHKEAIADFRSLFTAFEDECRQYMEQRTCGEWCGYGYRLMKSTHENLFFTEEGFQIRQAWITANADKVLALLKAQPGGAANRSQPIRAETNRTSAAAGPDP